MAVVALTDIHGRYDCLLTMRDLLQKKFPEGKHKIVFCGDYIDRGPNSKEVVEALMSRSFFGDWETVFLKGNHEEMFISFVDHARFSNFVNNGGNETIESFMDVKYTEFVEMARLNGSWRPMRDFPIMGRVCDWFKAMPYIHVDGKFLFVHAGLAPGHTAEEQIKNPEDWNEHLTWIRDPFLRSDKDFGYHIVHGHTPHAHDIYRKCSPFRTNLDSGAFYTGRLTGVIIHDTNDRDSREIVEVSCGEFDY